MPLSPSRNGVVTHINVFTVEPEKQQRLVDSLIETVNASHEAAQAVLRHLAAGGYLKRNTELGTVAPGQYEVVYTLEKA
jgi:hypothetical protein